MPESKDAFPRAVTGHVVHERKSGRQKHARANRTAKARCGRAGLLACKTTPTYRTLLISLMSGH
eukprot:14081564-Alexandrium_andersonii.AAC.1